MVATVAYHWPALWLRIRMGLLKVNKDEIKTLASARRRAAQQAKAEAKALAKAEAKNAPEATSGNQTRIAFWFQYTVGAVGPRFCSQPGSFVVRSIQALCSVGAGCKVGGVEGVEAVGEG